MKSYWAKSIASIAVCAMGTACMYFTHGQTGIGWAILGLMIVWD